MKFCNEPIEKVFQMNIRENIMPTWCDAYFQFCYKFEYHTTYGYWFLFETENFYITLGADGVIKYPKPHEFPQVDYEISEQGLGEEPFYEELIFTGQHICEVKTQGSITEITFDDFSMKIYSYKENESKWFEDCARGKGEHLMPVGTHMLGKCECGGLPEIYLDAHGDFIIRCSECHKATYSNMWFKTTMDDWNTNNTPITFSTGKEVFLKTVKEQKIKSIVVSKWWFEDCGEDSCWAQEMIFEFESTKIGVSAYAIDEDYSVFSYLPNITNYNPEMYCYKIAPTQDYIEYVGCDSIYGREEMLLKIDNTNLRIGTNAGGVVISLPENKYENDGVEPQRTKLFLEETRGVK